jgi:anti-sigma factor RsiW
MNAGNRTGRGDDHSGMTCRRCREAVSAMLDGEQLPEDEFLVRTHLPRCAECRAAADRMREITGAVRSWPDEPVPDLAALVAALAEPAAEVPAGSCCAGSHGRLRAVGNAACGCVAGCGCGCQDGKRCACAHAA